MERERLEIRIRQTRCPFCHDTVEKGSPAALCEQCQAIHHRECFDQHGGCSACGEMVGGMPMAKIRRRTQALTPPTRAECRMARCVRGKMPHSDLCTTHNTIRVVSALVVVVLGVLALGLFLISIT